MYGHKIESKSRGKNNSLFIAFLIVRCVSLFCYNIVIRLSLNFLSCSVCECWRPFVITLDLFLRPELFYYLVL